MANGKTWHMHKMIIKVNNSLCKVLELRNDHHSRYVYCTNLK